MIGFVSCQDRHTIKSEYFPNGGLKSKTTYLNDTVIDGVKETYYRTGVLSSRMNYKQGVKNGKFEIFHRSGALHVRGEHKNDMPFGHIVEFYDSSMEIVEKEYYSVIAEGDYLSSDLRQYDKAGNLLRDETISVSDLKYINGITSFMLTYHGSDITEYDSMGAIVGPFKHGFTFKNKADFDTVTLNKKSVRISLNAKPDTIRAKFLTYRSYDGEGDTLITEMRYFYFEKPTAEIKD